jgi:hypothetical protein
VLAQPRHHRKTGQGFQRRRCAGRGGEFGALDQLLVDLLLFGNAQTIGHLDDADAVDEGFVVLVGLEALPLGFVGVGEDHAGERYRADILGADIVAFLRRCEQRMQHLDRRLEHFDEFKHALIGAVEAAGIGVGVGIVLRVGLELADIDLADKRGDVLIVLVTRFSLRDADLAQHRREALDDLELADVAAVLLQPLDGPGRKNPVQVAAGDAVFLFEDLAVFGRVEQAEWRFIDGRALDGVERHVLHELLQPLGDGALAAAHRAQQVKDLLLFFQALRGVAKIGHHLFYGFFHAIELLERGIDLDDLVGEDPRKTGVVSGVHQFGFANGLEHALGGSGIRRGVALAGVQVVLQRDDFLAGALVAGGKVADHIHGHASIKSMGFWPDSVQQRRCATLKVVPARGCMPRKTPLTQSA